MGQSQGSLERAVHTHTGLPKKDRNISNKPPNPMPTRTRGTTMKTTQSKYKEGNPKIRAELNDTETKRTIQWINKSRSCFFEKTNKINKTLTRLIKKKGERIQINKMRNGREEITNDTTEIQRIVRKYYEELYAKKFENLGEMDKFLEKYNLTKLNEEEAESLNRLITAGEIEAVVKKLLAQKIPGTDCF